MPRLEMEITDKMMRKLQERANTYAMKSSDIAKWILASELTKVEKPMWTDKIAELVSRLSDALIAVSKMETHK